MSAPVPHGAIALIEANCTSCMICARECPAWCITIEAHSEPLPDSPPGPRQRTHQVLDAFTIDFGLCLACGICIEECPFDALEWAGAHAPSTGGAADLVHGRERLGAATREASAAQPDAEGGSPAATL